MHSATAYVIRDVRPDDHPALARLGWGSEEHRPTGHILVGEIRGVVAALLAVDENRSALAAVTGAPSLLAHMRAQAAGIRAHRRTASVADRLRERMRRRVTPAA